jgi:D-psicose/D-tagatose/L-ribulose 3-epimerase
MKFGMNLQLWTLHVTEQHDSLLAELAEIGFDGVELYLGRGDEAHYRALGRRLADLGLEACAITACDAEHDPISPDPGVRAAATEHLRWAIDMAAAVGAKQLSGPFHSAFKTFSGAPPTTDEFARSAEVLRTAAEYAAAEHGAAGTGTRGLTLAIEPLNRFECYLMNTVAGALEVVERVDHPSLGMLYDTHHMHIEEKDVADAIRRGGAHIRHVHTSENDRGRPGAGQVAWSRTFEALAAIDYDGWLMIESFSREDPEFAAAIHVWREFDPPMDVARGGLAFLREAWRASGARAATPSKLD